MRQGNDTTSSRNVQNWTLIDDSYIPVNINGMKVQFRRPENGTLRMLVRSAMSLPFVPVKRMEAAVNILQEIANSLEVEEQRSFGEKFMSYLHRQWLKNFDKEDLKSWNFYSKKGSYTNNPRYINEKYFNYELIKILL